MRDPYLYPHTDILKNLADIRDREILSCMEAEYTTIRLAELVIGESVSRFDFAALCDMHHYIFQDIYEWAGKIRVINEVAKIFSKYSADLWKVHPYREGNTRTVITFCSQFIESKGFYIDSDLFKDHAQYMRTALVAATALFSDLGDRRKQEYLEKIVLDALERGQEMKQRVSDVIKKVGFKVTEGRIRKIVYWNRLEQHEHGEQDVRLYLLQNEESK